MIRFFLVIICFTYSLFSNAKDFTINGYIVDSNSGETLINATVLDLPSSRGTTSNNYGFFSLSLPEGDVSVIISFVGYFPQNIEFVLSKDTLMTIQLEASTELNELVVMSNKPNRDVKSTRMSVVEIPVTQIKSIPALLGESDVLKALQLLPGVQGGVEGTTGLYVRGGGPEQNLLLLDGISVYNVTHMLGTFSVFNSDAIKNVTLYKGNFPARFGGRLSSVVDFRTNDGNLYEYHGNVSIGFISSKFNIEGPIKKGKSSFNISARRTYIDFLTEPILKKMASKLGTTFNGAGYYFYDFNANVSHIFNDKNRLYLSTYVGNDVINATNQISHGVKTTDNDEKVEFSKNMKMDWDWGNLLTSLRWNKIINNKLFMNLSTSYTHYRFLLNMKSEYQEFSSVDNNYTNKMRFNSGIEDFSLKFDFDYIPMSGHNVKFGVNSSFHNFKPGVSSVIESELNESYNRRDNDMKILSQETACYLEDDFSITKNLKTNIGFHFTTFSVQKKRYYSLQPRISACLFLADDLSFKTAFATMSQYMHLLSNNNVSLPTDLWLPVTERIMPMESKQFTAGFFYNYKKLIDFSLEGYYKTMNNVIEYKDGASFWGSVDGWEDKVSVGKGWSYGIECLAQKTYGKTTGWVAYTWSKSNRLFDRKGDELNFGKVFPAKYDRRHELNFVMIHKLNQKFEFSLTWKYCTGNAGTLETQSYESLPLPVNKMIKINSTLSHIPQRNSYRYPDYHRMDVGLTYHQYMKKGTGTWNFSVYNIYNRLNPFMVYIKSEFLESGNNRKSLRKITLLPFLPSISYHYKF